MKSSPVPDVDDDPAELVTCTSTAPSAVVAGDTAVIWVAEFTALLTSELYR